MTSPIIDDRTDKLLEQMRQQAERLAPRVEALMAADPQMKPWTAMTIAQDEESLVRAREAIAAGGNPEHEVNIVGSYARFDAAVELLPPKVLYRDIIELWRGADPDDSKPEFLAAWKAAHAAKVGPRPKHPTSYLRDGKPIPGRGRVIEVYRGQDAGPPSGIAWSTSSEVAERFATGAATRQRDREGVLLYGSILREKVLAYITGRGEFEVVLDPTDLMFVTELARWKRVEK